jgi:cytochrome c nitrite reductase small subunit
MKLKRPPRWVVLVLCGLLISGGGAFYYAGGMAIVSGDPRACVHCHIMLEPYDGWTRSVHNEGATCNDCHLPQGLVSKCLSTVSNGVRYSIGVMSADHPRPIPLRAESSRVVQDNCIRCHGQLIRGITECQRQKAVGTDCVGCHGDVSHMSRKPAGAPATTSVPTRSSGRLLVGKEGVLLADVGDADDEDAHSALRPVHDAGRDVDE